MIKLTNISKNTKNFLTATSIIAGTCIGAGFLGLPYVTAQSGFFISLIYLLVFGGIILLINLYIGEIALRTKNNNHLVGYAEKYLGKAGKTIMLFATKFAINSAIIAYIIGIGGSISFLLFGSKEYFIFVGVIFALIMSFLIWKGESFLKIFEKGGVLIALILLLTICLTFFDKIHTSNLLTLNFKKVLLPFGIVLFSLMSFFSIPTAKKVLNSNKVLLKKSIIVGTIIPIIFYILFILVVVGYKGSQTPEIATFGLGKLFVLIGTLTMFTSYLSLGNVLKQNYESKSNCSKKKAWFKATIIPIILFLSLQVFEDFFSFIKITSIGGVFSGGLVVFLVLIINKKSEILGDRNPEFKIPINRLIIIGLSIVFLFGIITELFKIY
jgi:amino acid transporter